MNFRLRKEIRENCWVLVGAVFAMVIVTVVVDDWRLRTFARSMHFIILIVAAGFFGAVPFAREFSERTMASLLVQPVSRSQIWLEKWSVSFLCWLVLAGSFAICAPIVDAGSNDRTSMSIVAPISLQIFLAGPFMALITRNVVLAVLFSCCTPAVTASLYFYVFPTGNLWFKSMSDFWIATSCGLPILSFFWFRRLQDKPALLTNPLRLPTFARSKFNISQAANGNISHPLHSLVRKELRLTVPFTIYAATTSILMLALMWRTGATWEAHPLSLSFWALVQTIVIPSLLGVSSVMKDRSPGLREHQLTSPVAMRVQWMIKLLVCVTVTMTTTLSLTITPSLFVEHLNSVGYWKTFQAIVIPILSLYFVVPFLMKSQRSVHFLIALLLTSLLTPFVAMIPLLDIIYDSKGDLQGCLNEIVAPTAAAIGALLVGLYAGSSCRTSVRAICAVAVFIPAAGVLLGILWSHWSTFVEWDPVATQFTFMTLALAASFFIGGRWSYGNIRFFRTSKELKMQRVQIGAFALALIILTWLKK
ncbi:MAG: hypothetical protein ACI9R3_003530 [Verrucomicrobiales bacterium]|jgi:hypothetical protein